MSLFSRLLNLNTGSIPLEDFFTELIAYLFSTNKELLYAWLKELNLFDTSVYLDAHISTQREFDPVDGQSKINRPDIVIELVDEDACDIIIIESKIGSTEMPGQLPKYAKVLDGMTNFRHKFLLFVTRDYEPKEKASIFEDIPDSDVQFKQLRWHQFYRFLRSQPDTMLVREIILFMSKYNMAHNNQFSSIDVITLANFPKSLKLMQETMWGRVRTEFKNVLGGVLNSASALTQIHYHGRYLMIVHMPDKWWCGLGFILRTDNATDYPKVRLVVEVNPSSPRREEIITVMKDICKQEKWENWEGRELNDSKAWSRIIREKSLQDFLSQPDHITAIEKFFLEALGELKDIRSEYPKLPWKAIAATAAESESTKAPFAEEQELKVLLNSETDEDEDESEEDETSDERVIYSEGEEPIITPPPELTGMATETDTESDNRKALFAEELDLKHQLKVLIHSNNNDEDAELKIREKLNVVRGKIGSRTTEEAYGAMAY